MTTLAPPLLFRFRETIATMPSALALLVLVLMGVQQTAKLVRHEDPEPVQIALVAPEPTPPQVQPKPPEPPKEKVVTPQPPKPVTPVQPTPVKTVQSTPTNTATPELPASPRRSSEAPAVTAPTAPAPATPPAPAPAPAPAAKPVTASLEAEYVGKIRAHLNSIKRYPTGREASQQRPQGKVRLWFVLRRDGSLVDVGVDESSNSALLDDAARKTINRASFSAFPESSWAGESTHRFTAELEFIPAS